MATIQEKEVLKHDAVEQKLRLRIRIDGKDHFQTRGKSASTNPVDHQAVLDEAATRLAARIDENNAQAGVEEVMGGLRDWSAMPEGDEKQRIAQLAIREVVICAREGKELQASGPERPKAFERYARTRQIKSNIWDNLAGTHVVKAAYLALEGPGAGTEYGELNGYMNDLGNAAADWGAVVTFMDTCTNPKAIKTEMTV